MRQTITWFFAIAFHCFGQSIDYWDHFPANQQQLIRFQFDNDFFASTDRYYSQGMSLLYRRPVGNGWDRLCFRLPDAQKRIGVAIDHMGYTAVSIAFDSILAADHPFAATMQTRLLFETVAPDAGRLLGWTVVTGFIGPEAQGKEMQTAIHKALGNPHPKGWRHQLNTGLIFDLGLHAEQRIAGVRDLLLLTAEGNANAGTMHTDLTTGLRLQFRLATRNDVWSILFYVNPAVRFVGYDGTLQGSLVSERSDYRISPEDVDRVVFEREFGAEGRVGPFILTGIFQLQSPQYRWGMTHRWEAFASPGRSDPCATRTGPTGISEAIGLLTRDRRLIIT